MICPELTGLDQAPGQMMQVDSSATTVLAGSVQSCEHKQPCSCGDELGGLSV